MATEEGTHNYTYDKIYQLTNVDYPAGISLSDKTYNYDELGNRVTVTNGVVTNYTSNNVNQYTEVNSVSYTYDANGNLTNDGEWTYNYDYENRLISATNGSLTAEYSYDAFGRRTQKRNNDSNAITNFIYDGDQIIGEYNDSGILQKKFVYGTGIDEPILMNDGTDKYYYHFDGLGSVTEITDDSGAIVEKYKYDVYGNTIIKDVTDSTLPASSIANPYMFTGRELDSETGLYYYRARYYSPSIGRFLQKDPYTWGPDDPKNLILTSLNNSSFTLLSHFRPESSTMLDQKLDTVEIMVQMISTFGLTHPQFLHAYLYCSNNPINLIDPLGLSCAKDPADLNNDGKVDKWDWWLWFYFRRYWDIANPPFTPYPPGYGDKGPGTNDPRLDPNRRRDKDISFYQDFYWYS